MALKVGKVVIARVTTGKLSCKGLEPRNDGEHGARLARTEPADDGSPVGQNFDQALGRQDLEGLA